MNDISLHKIKGKQEFLLATVIPSNSDWSSSNSELGIFPFHEQRVTFHECRKEDFNFKYLLLFSTLNWAAIGAL